MTISRNDALIRAAKMRAAVLALLNTHRGITFNLEQIEAEMRPLCNELEATSENVRYVLNTLITSDLISSWLEKKQGSPPIRQYGHISLSKNTSPTTKDIKSSSSKDIEIAINGITIIIGKNDKTGRPRITIE